MPAFKNRRSRYSRLRYLATNNRSSLKIGVMVYQSFNITFIVKYSVSKPWKPVLNAVPSKS